VGRQFNAFTASELHCPKCGRSQPVRERPAAANTTDLLCSRCATVLGQHTVVDHSLGGKLTRLVAKLVKK
jgi:ribosomal protein S27AE